VRLIRSPFTIFILSSHLADPSSIFILSCQGPDLVRLLQNCSRWHCVYPSSLSHKKQGELTNTLTAKKLSPLLSKTIAPSVFLPETACHAPDVVDPLNIKVYCHLYNFVVHMQQLKIISPSVFLLTICSGLLMLCLQSRVLWEAKEQGDTEKLFGQKRRRFCSRDYVFC
jgi:hypothetical protein